MTLNATSILFVPGFTALNRQPYNQKKTFDFFPLLQASFASSLVKTPISIVKGRIQYSPSWTVKKNFKNTFLNATFLSLTHIIKNYVKGDEDKKFSFLQEISFSYTAGMIAAPISLTATYPIKMFRHLRCPPEHPFKPMNINILRIQPEFLAKNAGRGALLAVAIDSVRFAIENNKL